MSKCVCVRVFACEYMFVCVLACASIFVSLCCEFVYKYIVVCVRKCVFVGGKVGECVEEVSKVFEGSSSAETRNAATNTGQPSRGGQEGQGSYSCGDGGAKQGVSDGGGIEEKGRTGQSFHKRTHSRDQLGVVEA